jgi:hypothetical protein
VSSPDPLATRAAGLLPDATSIYLSLASLEADDAQGLDLPPVADRRRVVVFARRLAAEIALLARLAEQQGYELEPLPFLISVEHSLLLLVEHEGETSELPLLSPDEVQAGLAALDGWYHAHQHASG